MSNQCYICFSEQERGENRNILISPCKCAGSMKYVHVDCLDRFRSTGIDANLKCKICNTFYKFKYGRIRCNRMFFEYFLARNLSGLLFSVLMCFILLMASFSLEYDWRYYCSKKEKKYIVNMFNYWFFWRMLYYMIVTFISHMCWIGLNRLKLNNGFGGLLFFGAVFSTLSIYPFSNCSPGLIHPDVDRYFLIVGAIIFAFGFETFIRYNIETLKILYGLMHEKSIMNYNELKI
ncbi:MAG: hypothetical protein Hyperionvirus1_132 [Hyperionvirus sp.]|uniref:E3 ubiquitin-protein ligase LAP n=1 Tax=Hyperionvirus sp. TaxID=2487770 RepID=A0A3G5A9N9_9VIRU|nr:MAG: hypothetical protein Hyperionvirus1_132 [Hyperionvirus sp.]